MIVGAINRGMRGKAKVEELFLYGLFNIFFKVIFAIAIVAVRMIVNLLHVEVGIDFLLIKAGQIYYFIPKKHYFCDRYDV